MDEAIRSEDPWGSLGDDTDEWYFCLRMLGERYAFQASQALEVIRLGPLTRLPAAPSFLPGVFHHRGEVLAALDLGQFLADRTTSLAQGSRTVIVEVGQWKLALLAEGIEGLIRLAEEGFEPPPGAGSAAAAFLSKVGQDAKGHVSILDLARLVDAARLRGVGS